MPGKVALEAEWRVLLKDMGIDSAAFLRRAELPAGLFADKDASLTQAQYFGFWRALEAESSGTPLALRLGRRISVEVFSPPIFASLCSPHLAAAAHRLADYKRLVAPATIAVEENADGLAVEFSWPDKSSMPPHSLTMSELVFVVALARLATREHIVPTLVESLSLPSGADEYSAYFGIAVRTGARNRVGFSTADARRPFLTANDALWSVFEPVLRRRLDELDESATLAERVKSSLLQALPAGRGSIDQIASRLAISKRTLQRRLMDEGTSFVAILRSTREELARHYLGQTALSGAEISYLLGFDDPDSFYRAFQGWTGKTTEQARAETLKRRVGED